METTVETESNDTTDNVNIHEAMNVDGSNDEKKTDSLNQTKLLLEKYLTHDEKLNNKEFIESEFIRINLENVEKLEELLTYEDEKGEKHLADITNIDHLKEIAKKRPVFIPSDGSIPKDKKNGLVALNPQDLPFPYHDKLKLKNEVLMELHFIYEKEICSQLYQLPFYDFPVYTSNLQLLFSPMPMRYVTNAWDIISTYILLCYYLRIEFPLIDQKIVLEEWIKRKDGFSTSEIEVILKAVSDPGNIINDNGAAPSKEQLLEIVSKCVKLPDDKELIKLISADTENPASSIVNHMHTNPIQDLREYHHNILEELNFIADLSINRKRIALERKKSIVKKLKECTIRFIRGMELYLLRSLANYIPQIHWGGFMTIGKEPNLDEINGEVLKKIKTNNLRKMTDQFKEFRKKAGKQHSIDTEDIDGFPRGIFRVLPIAIKEEMEAFQQELNKVSKAMDKMEV